MPSVARDELRKCVRVLAQRRSGRSRLTTTVARRAWRTMEPFRKHKQFGNLTISDMLSIWFLADFSRLPECMNLVPRRAWVHGLDELRVVQFSLLDTGTRLKERVLAALGLCAFHYDIGLHLSTNIKPIRDDLPLLQQGIDHDINVELRSALSGQMDNGHMVCDQR